MRSFFFRNAWFFTSHRHSRQSVGSHARSNGDEDDNDDNDDDDDDALTTVLFCPRACTQDYVVAAAVLPRRSLANTGNRIPRCRSDVNVRTRDHDSLQEHSHVRGLVTGIHRNRRTLARSGSARAGSDGFKLFFLASILFLSTSQFLRYLKYLIINFH